MFKTASKRAIPNTAERTGDLIVNNRFVKNKSFGLLLDNSTEIFIFLKTFNSGFSYIEI